VGFRGGLFTSDGWKELLSGAGLKNIEARVYKADSVSNKRDDLIDLLRVAPRFLLMYIKNPAFRRFIKETFNIPKNLVEYIGYGIYIGRK